MRSMAWRWPPTHAGAGLFDLSRGESSQLLEYRTGVDKIREAAALGNELHEAAAQLHALGLRATCGVRAVGLPTRVPHADFDAPLAAMPRAIFGSTPD